MNKIFGFIANSYHLWHNKQSHIVGLKRVYLMDSNTVEEALTKIVKLSIAKKEMWDSCGLAPVGTACILDIKSNSHLYLITCAHVVQQAVNFALSDVSNRKIGYGQVLLTDPEFDLAIVVARVVVSAGSALKAATYTDTMFADEVMAFGVPISSNKFPNWCPGIIRCPASLLARDVASYYVHDYDVANRTMIHSSAEMVQGMSGGAIVNMMGKLVGYPCIGNSIHRNFYGGKGIEIGRLCQKANKYVNYRTTIRLREHSLKLGLRLKIKSENNCISILYQIIMPSIGNEQLQGNNINFGIIVGINGQPIQSIQYFINSINQSSANNPCVVNIIQSLQRLTRNIWIDPDIENIKFV